MICCCADVFIEPLSCYPLVGKTFTQWPHPAILRRNVAACLCPIIVVVTKFIQDKAESVSKRQSNTCIDAASSIKAGHLWGGVQQSTLRGRLAQRFSSRKFPAKPLFLHENVFKVSLARGSVHELRQWILKAASGRECPDGFNFPAVDQTVSKAWIEAYDVMDVLKRTTPCVLWSKAVEEFSSEMSGSLDASDAGKVLLRAMQHREAEGGVLLSLADASAPVATDMLHLDPSWLIELVRRLADHNLVDENEKKQGTIKQQLRAYARQQHLDFGPLWEMHGWVR